MAALTSLRGLRLYITGTVPGMSKAKAEALVAAAGAHIESGMTRGMDLLVVAPKAGPAKLQKAQQWGIQTIGWEEAARLANGTPVQTKPAPTPTVRHQPVPAQAGYRQIKPMLCKGSDGLPAGGDWLLEIKWDGYRALAHVQEGGTILASRSGKQLVDYPQIVAELDQLVPCILDGEIAVLDEHGASQFERLHAGDTADAKLVVFDVLECAGTDVRHQPLRERRRLLESIVDGGIYVTCSPTFELQEAEALLGHCRKHGLEGVVAKKSGSSYQEGARNDSWLKVKLRLEQEFVVVGYTAGKGNRQGTAGALLLAVNDGTKAKPRWTYCGSAGSGGTYQDYEAIVDRTKALSPNTLLEEEHRNHPYHANDLTPAEMRETTWVKPELVVQVRFQRWTSDGKLWHPSIKGLRDDKEPEDVRRET